MTPPTLESVQETIVALTVRVEQAQTETKRWQVITILLPVVATAILGLLVERSKSSIQEQINMRSQQLGARLVLTEEFYKRKLDVHEKIYKQLVVVVAALQDAKFNPDKRTEAVNSLATLYNDYTSSGLYVGPELLAILKHFEDTATGFPALYSGGTATMGQLNTLFAAAQQRMARDLQLDDLQVVR
jgi:hypothetical protein